LVLHVQIECLRYAAAGVRYRVMHLGKTLVASTRDPEFEACRAMLAKGFKGTLVSYGPGSSVPSVSVDIERGARLAAIENDKDGPKIGRYRRHPSSVVEDAE